MKTLTFKPGKAKLTRLAVFFLLMFGLFSCEYYGMDGRPGRSYLALNWEVSEPYYIEAGNKYIPEVFYWGEYYRVPSGIYLLYYEGEYHNGRRWIDYAWEVEYEIWENSGEYGRPNGIDGFDGADVDFEIICSPDGPAVYYEEFYKSADSEILKGYEIIQNTDDVIEIKQTKEDFTLRVKYHKVEPKHLPVR